MTVKVIEAFELRYGDKFRVLTKAQNIDPNSIYTWLGDEFDEDTLWITEISTTVSFALDKQQQVELVSS